MPSSIAFTAWRMILRHIWEERVYTSHEFILPAFDSLFSFKRFLFHFVFTEPLDKITNYGVEDMNLNCVAVTMDLIQLLRSPVMSSEKW